MQGERPRTDVWEMEDQRSFSLERRMRWAGALLGLLLIVTPFVWQQLSDVAAELDPLVVALQTGSDAPDTGQRPGAEPERRLPPPDASTVGFVVAGASLLCVAAGWRRADPAEVPTGCEEHRWDDPDVAEVDPERAPSYEEWLDWLLAHSSR